MSPSDLVGAIALVLQDKGLRHEPPQSKPPAEPAFVESPAICTYDVFHRENARDLTLTIIDALADEAAKTLSVFHDVVCRIAQDDPMIGTFLVYGLHN